MLAVAQARELTAVVVPVYFQPTVDRDTVIEILEATFADQLLFCSPDRLLAVVDRDTCAEEVLRQARPGSPLHGLPLHFLDRNRGKAGAVWEGLSQLLSRTDAAYLVTRDCDGDHVVEDLPRLVSMAHDIQQNGECTIVSVFGGRPSLERPMGWLRQEWEHLVNQVLVDMADFLAARAGRVIDKRYWNGYELDIQNGYRVYSREAAHLAVEALAQLPDDNQIMVLSCEPLPFLEMMVHQGMLGQVQRLTLVEQAVSSFQGVDFSRSYGALLAYLAGRYEVPANALLQIFDNHAVNSSMYYSSFREGVFECRRQIDGKAAPPGLPGFL